MSSGIHRTPLSLRPGNNRAGRRCHASRFSLFPFPAWHYAVPGVILLGLVGGAGEPGEAPLSVLGRHELTCPLCRRAFTTVTCSQSNARGGVDRDLFTRALGPQPEFYRVSTCPRCGYSGYASDFGAGVSLPAEFRERVLAEPKLPLPEGFGPESDPRDLGAADRYALAIQCYQWRHKPDEALAWLHLRASWVAREEGSVLPPDDRLARVFAFAACWRPVLAEGDNQADGELRMATHLVEAAAVGRFNRYQRPYVELAAALILRRHGENRPAAVILDRLAGSRRGAAPQPDDAGAFSTALLEGIDRMRASIGQERRQQRAAAACFERALLAGQIDAANRGPACYLLGELYRRLGQEPDAARWFDQALADERLPDGLRTWAREQKTSCGGTQAGREP